MYENMMDQVTKKFGFEDVRTIRFYEFCECAGSAPEAECAVTDEFHGLMKQSVMEG